MCVASFPKDPSSDRFVLSKVSFSDCTSGVFQFAGIKKRRRAKHAQGRVCTYVYNFGDVPSSCTLSICLYAYHYGTFLHVHRECVLIIPLEERGRKEGERETKERGVS